MSQILQRTIDQDAPHEPFNSRRAGASAGPGAGRTRSGTFDAYMVGVGGQGVLTIGELLAEAAFAKGIPVNFYPTKGMAQRGGFVKAQLRIGRAAEDLHSVGPAIAEKGADLIVATEVSEALKAVRYARPGGDFVLYGYVWQPTAVMLGKASYPSLEQVLDAARAAVRAGGLPPTTPAALPGPAASETRPAGLVYIDPRALPLYEGLPVPDNVFTLGVILRNTALGRLLSPDDVERVLETRWKQAARARERNLFAFHAGLEFQPESGKPDQGSPAGRVSDPGSAPAGPPPEASPGTEGVVGGSDLPA